MSTPTAKRVAWALTIVGAAGVFSAAHLTRLSIWWAVAALPYCLALGLGFAMLLEVRAALIEILNVNLGDDE